MLAPDQEIHSINLGSIWFWDAIDVKRTIYYIHESHNMFCVTWKPATTIALSSLQKKIHNLPFSTNTATTISIHQNFNDLLYDLTTRLPRSIAFPHDNTAVHTQRASSNFILDTACTGIESTPSRFSNKILGRRFGISLHENPVNQQLNQSQILNCLHSICFHTMHYPSI